jgi:hypothetical protein
MSTVVTQLIIDARGAEEGSAAYIRAMNDAQRAVDKSIDREAKLQGAVDKTVVTLARGAGGVDQITRKWNSLIASVDPVAAAQQKAAKAIEDATLRADAAVRRLGVSQEDAAAVVGAVREKYEQATQEIIRNAEAANDNSAALARMRAQYDPIFAAQLKHKQALEGISEAEQAGAISTKIATDARRAALSVMNDTIQKLERMAQTQKEAAQRSVNQQLIVPDRGADIAAYAAALDAAQAKWDPLFAAEKTYMENLEELQNLLGAGALSQEVYNARVAEQGEALDVATAKAKGYATAQKSSADALKIAAQSQEEFNRLLGVRDDFGTASRAADIEAYGRAVRAARAEFDPLARAQDDYREGLERLRTAYAGGAISQDAFNDRLREQKAAFVDTMASLGRMTAQQREYAEASAAAARVSQIQGVQSAVGTDVEAYAKSISDLTAKYDPLFAAQRQYKAVIAEIGELEQSGVLNQQQAAKAVENARINYNNQIVAMNKAEAANQALAKGVGLNAYAWQNLSFQVNDVVTSLASGISPFQTIAQQGGQIVQILQTGQGGVAGSLAAIRDRILAISPVVGIFGVLAAGLTLAAFAANSFAKAQRDVQLALLGSGQGAGVSADQIQDFAEKAARSSTITVAAARDIEKAFLDGGKVYGEVFQKGITAADDFAKKTGGAPVDAAKMIGAALSDLGGGGFEKLAKEAGNFDSAFEKTVRDALTRGDDLKAQQLVIERFGEAFDKASTKATGLQSVLQRMDQTFNNAAESFGKTVIGAFQPAPVQKQLDDAVSARRNLTSVAPDADTSALDAKIARLTKARDENTASTQKNAQSVRDNADANLKAVSSISAPVKSLEDLRAGYATANKAVSAFENQQATGVKIPVDQYNAAKESLAGYAAGIKDYAVANGAAGMEAEKARKVLAAGLQTIQAITPEQKAAAQSATVLANAFGTSESGTKRSREAADAYNRSMAEARQQTINTNRVQDESTATANKLADANTKTGNSVEFLRARRQAEQEAAAGTISQDEIGIRTSTILSNQIGSLNQQKAEQIRTARDGVSAQQKANAEVAAGSIVSAEASRKVALYNQQQQLTREIEAASGADKEALTARLKELTAATEAQIDADKRAQVLSMTEETNRQLELLQKEADLLGSTNRERQIELAALQAKQNLQRQGISTTAPESVEYINKEKLKADVAYARDQYTRMSQDITSALGGIFDDLTSGGKKNLTTFLDSFSKGFAKIGSKALQDNLIGPLVSGGLDGSGKSGGGIFDSIGKLFSGNGLEKAVAGGSEKGLLSGFTSIFSDQKNGASNGAFAKSGFGGALASAAVGGSIGYSSQSPTIGLLGGAATGLATGGIAGAAVGGIAGLLGGLFGESQAKKQAKKQLQEKIQAMKDALTEARPQIEALDLMFTGGALGTVGKNVTDAQSQAAKAIKTASDGGDQALADKLMKDFQTYVARQVKIFADGFNGTMAEVEAGFGTNGPFATAVSSVQQLGEALKGFVSDAGRLSDPAAQVAARSAAVQGALKTLDPTPTLSDTQKELSRIQGTAAGLNQVLQDLGVSAADAAQMIQDKTTVALDNLRQKFDTDIGRKINDAQDKGYLNDAADLIKEVQGLQADAGSVGGDLGQVQTYFGAAAQKIVDSSQLVGDAFNQLVAAFPQLAGVIHAYSDNSAEASKAAAEAAAQALSEIQDRKRAYEDRAFAVNFSDNSLSTKLTTFDRNAEWEQWTEMAKGGQALDELIATQVLERNQLIAAYNEAVKERKLSFQDRTFAANTDTSTLAGQLAAYDRKAGQERLDEIKNGGEAIADLEQAQAAERLKIIRDFNKQAQTAFDNFANTIKKFLDNMLAGADSPLSPEARLKAAQDQYNQQIALAQGGDQTALGGITGYAQTLLDASKAFYASSDGFQAIFQQIRDTLSALPGQVGVGAFATYATGGWVSGPGTGTSDSIVARVSNGEFVMSAAAAAKNGPLLEALNGDRPMATFTMAGRPAASSNGGIAEIVAELGRLRAELAELTGIAQTGNEIAAEGHTANINATKSMGANLARGDRAAARKEVMAA